MAQSAAAGAGAQDQRSRWQPHRKSQRPSGFVSIPHATMIPRPKRHRLWGAGVWAAATGMTVGARPKPTLQVKNEKARHPPVHPFVRCVCTGRPATHRLPPTRVAALAFDWPHCNATATGRRVSSSSRRQELEKAIAEEGGLSETYGGLAESIVADDASTVLRPNAMAQQLPTSADSTAV